MLRCTCTGAIIGQFFILFYLCTANRTNTLHAAHAWRLRVRRVGGGRQAARRREPREVPEGRQVPPAPRQDGHEGFGGTYVRPTMFFFVGRQDSVGTRVHLELLKCLQLGVWLFAEAIGSDGGIGMRWGVVGWAAVREAAVPPRLLFRREGFSGVGERRCVFGFVHPVYLVLERTAMPCACVVKSSLGNSCGWLLLVLSTFPSNSLDSKRVGVFCSRSLPPRLNPSLPPSFPPMPPFLSFPLPDSLRGLAFAAFGLFNLPRRPTCLVSSCASGWPWVVLFGQDMLMMATLISKVQLLRDLRALQAEAKAQEQKRQDSLLQSNSKVSLGRVCRYGAIRQEWEIPAGNGERRGRERGREGEMAFVSQHGGSMYTTEQPVYSGGFHPCLSPCCR